MRPCFKFTAKAGDKPAVLALDEEIGFWGTQAKDFRAQLNAVEGNALDVEINSPGGDVFAGLGMYNMLRTWAAHEGRSVTTRITGVAASIASIIALAGDKREMPSNAFAMVHAVSSFAWGTADELREAADVTDKVQGSLRNIYVDRMGIDEAKATEIMAKDTWLTADECLEMGFVTNLTDAVEATAKFDLARADLPEHVAKVFKAKEEAPVVEDKTDPIPEPEVVSEVVPETPVAEQIVAEAKASGFEALSAFFAVNFDALDKAKERIGQAREIAALCKFANKADMAAQAIRTGKSVSDVRAELVKVLAEADEETHTSNARKDETKGKDAAVSSSVNPTAIWNSHNSQVKKDAK